MTLNRLAIYYLIALAFIFGGTLEIQGIAWYESLVHPAWNPPTWLIAIIWVVIYVSAGRAFSLLAQRSKHDARSRLITYGFALSILLNVAWNFLFFTEHLFLVSVVCAIVLGCMALALVALAFPRSEKAAALLLPYTIWVFFAGYLTYVVMLLNT